LAVMYAIHLLGFDSLHHATILKRDMTDVGSVTLS